MRLVFTQQMDLSFPFGERRAMLHVAPSLSVKIYLRQFNNQLPVALLAQSVRCAVHMLLGVRVRVLASAWSFSGFFHRKSKLRIELRWSWNLMFTFFKNNEDLWTFPYAECSPPLSSYLANGHVQGSGRVYRSNYNFTCNSGYILFGDDYITCTENGTWNGTSPVCVKGNENLLMTL